MVGVLNPFDGHISSKKLGNIWISSCHEWLLLYDMESEVAKAQQVGFVLGLPMVSSRNFRTLASRCTEHEAAIKSSLALELTADSAPKRENYTKILQIMTEVTGSKWRG